MDHYTIGILFRQANYVRKGAVPSETEFMLLTTYIGGFDGGGKKLKETGTAHWNNPNTDATYEFGFIALPGGYTMGGYFFGMGDVTLIWTPLKQITVMHMSGIFPEFHTL